jgi:hypothetical protein
MNGYGKQKGYRYNHKKQGILGKYAQKSLHLHIVHQMVEFKNQIGRTTAEAAVSSVLVTKHEAVY